MVDLSRPGDNLTLRPSSHSVTSLTSGLPPPLQAFPQVEEVEISLS